MKILFSRARVLFITAFIAILGISTYLTSTSICTLDKIKGLSGQKVVPLAVIGGGPAGLSAAMYSSRAKIPTVVFTGDNLGGNLNAITKIENFPAKPRMSGRALAKVLEKQAEKFGTQFAHDTVTDVDFKTWPFTIQTKKGLEVKALSVIAATGFSPKTADLPGVKKYWGKGVGICTICDAAFTKGQNVVVIGTNDYCAEKALQLAPYAKKVYMIEKEPVLQATGSVQDYLRKEENIEFIFNHALVAIEGTDQEVTSARLKNTKTGKEKILPVQSIFVTARYVPNSSLFKDQLELNKDGYIQIGCDSQATSVPGVFAAGTVEDSVYGKAGVESGRGMQAALDAINFMIKKVGYNQVTAKNIDLFVPDEQVAFKIPPLRDLVDLKQKTNKYNTVVLFIYSKMCMDCRQLKPQIQLLGKAFEDNDRVGVFKAEINETKAMVDQLDVNTVPMMLIFQGDNVIKKVKGKKTFEELKKIVDATLAGSD